MWCGVPVAAILYRQVRTVTTWKLLLFARQGGRGQGLRVSSIVHVSDAHHDFPDTAGQRSHRDLIWPACVSLAFMVWMGTYLPGHSVQAGWISIAALCPS